MAKGARRGDFEVSGSYGIALSEEAKVRRRLFAAHYIKTTQPIASAVYAGFREPGSKSRSLLKEPYVQDLILKMLETIELDAIMTQQEIMLRLKKEAYDESSRNQSARISALAHLAKIRGMLIDRQEAIINGGGVMVVPAITDPDTWGKVAEKAQTILRDAARD